MITFGSLFSGIGGIDLGLERAGMACKWQVEINDYCQKVLQKHWPEVRKYKDVREVGKHNLEPVDLIAGGFPCQDVSLAGKRKGLEGKRSTLWSEFYRIICEIRPGWVFIENVPGLLSANNGRFMRKILWELSAIGFNAEWETLPAALVGAPHRRYRVFIVANSKCQSINFNVALRQIVGEWSENEKIRGSDWVKLGMGNSEVAYSKWKSPRQHIDSRPLLVRSDDGFSNGVDRLKALGNAVVPQAAEFIGRCIVDADKSLTYNNK